MLTGRPGEGTPIRTVKELQATSGATVPPGTEGTLLEIVATGRTGEDEPTDIFVARLGDVVMQVLREDVEEVRVPG